MKQTNAIIAITLSIGIFANSLCSEASSTTSSSLITWMQSGLYNAYQGMISSATGLISIPYSIMNVVGAWSDQQKVYVATAAVASLLAIYQKAIIKKWFNDMIDRLTATEETRQLLKDVDVEEVPWDKNYKKRVENL
jgi:hypothetical protein